MTGADLWVLSPWFLYALGACAIAVALLFGGREERLFAVTLALGGVVNAVTGFVVLGAHSSLEGLEDVVFFTVAVLLALRSDKVWVFAAASLTLASLMTQAAQGVAHVAPQAYAMAQGTWTLLVNLVLIAGALTTWRSRRREQRLGASLPT